jgi:hypothetical protein
MDVVTADLATTMASRPEPARTEAPDVRHLALSATAQVVGAPVGQYRFTVDVNSEEADSGDPGLAWPAVHIAGLPEDRVTFVEGTLPGQWLRRPGDSFTANVRGGAGLFILTSVRAAGGRALEITIARIDASARSDLPQDEGAPAPTFAAGLVEPDDPDTDSSAAPLRDSQANFPPPDAFLRIATRIRARGEIDFSDVDWAGRLGKGRTIDGFMVEPLRDIAPQEIEYKALTAAGVETPWLAGGSWCTGPEETDSLVGFALRLKERALLHYECEYMGYFQSATITEPVCNGTPCRSRLPKDPLEGIHIRIFPKGAARVEVPSEQAPPVAAAADSVDRPVESGEPREIADQMAEIAAFAAQLTTARAARAARSVGEGEVGARQGRRELI